MKVKIREEKDGTFTVITLGLQESGFVSRSDAEVYRKECKRILRKKRKINKVIRSKKFVS